MLKFVMTRKEQIRMAAEWLRPRAIILLRFMAFHTTFALAVLLPMLVMRRLDLSNSLILVYASLSLLPASFRPFIQMLIGTTGHYQTWITGSAVLLVGCLLLLSGSIETSLGWRSYYVFFQMCIVSAAVITEVALVRLHRLSLFGYGVRRSRAPYLLLSLTLSLLFGIGVLSMIGGNLEVVTRSIGRSWATVYRIAAVFMSVVYALLLLLLNMEKRRKHIRKLRMSDMFYAHLNTFADLIRTPSSWPGLLFIYLFPLPVGCRKR